MTELSVQNAEHLKPSEGPSESPAKTGRQEDLHTSTLSHERSVSPEVYRDQVQALKEAIVDAKELVKHGSEDAPYLQAIARLAQEGDRLARLVSPRAVTAVVENGKNPNSELQTAAMRFFEKSRGFHTTTESVLTVASMKTHLARMTLASHGLLQAAAALSLVSPEASRNPRLSQSRDVDRETSEQMDLTDPSGSKTPSYSPRIRSALKVMGTFNKAVDTLIDVCVTASNPIKSFRALSESNSTLGQVAGYAGWTAGLTLGAVVTGALLPAALTGSAIGIGLATAAAMTTPLFMSMGSWLGNAVGSRISSFFGYDTRREATETFSRFYEKENQEFEASAGVFTDMSGSVQQENGAYQISRGKKKHLIQRLGEHSAGLLEYALERASERQDRQGNETPLLLEDVLTDARALQEEFESGEHVYYPNGTLTQHGYIQIQELLRDVDPHMKVKESVVDTLWGTFRGDYAAKQGYTDLEKDLRIQALGEQLLEQLQGPSGGSPESFHADTILVELKTALEEGAPRYDRSGNEVGVWEVPDIAVEYDVPADMIDGLHSLGKVVGGLPPAGIPSMIGAGMCSLSAVLSLGRDLLYGRPKEQGAEESDSQELSGNMVSRFFGRVKDSGLSFVGRVKDAALCLIPGVSTVIMYNELRRYQGHKPGTLDKKQEGPSFAEVRAQIADWLKNPNKWERIQSALSRVMNEYETVRSAKRRSR